MPGHVHSFYTQRQFIQTRAKGLEVGWVHMGQCEL
jgi:hypothetical protein